MCINSSMIEKETLRRISLRTVSRTMMQKFHIFPSKEEELGVVSKRVEKTKKRNRSKDKSIFRKYLSYKQNENMEKTDALSDALSEKNEKNKKE